HHRRRTGQELAGDLDLIIAELAAGNPANEFAGRVPAHDAGRVEAAGAGDGTKSACADSVLSPRRRALCRYSCGFNPRIIIGSFWRLPPIAGSIRRGTPLLFQRPSFAGFRSPQSVPRFHPPLRRPPRNPSPTIFYPGPIRFSLPCKPMDSSAPAG